MDVFTRETKMNYLCKCVEKYCKENKTGVFLGKGDPIEETNKFIYQLFLSVPEPYHIIIDDQIVCYNNEI